MTNNLGRKVSATVASQGTAAQPTMSPNGGNVPYGQKVTISDVSPGAQINYSILPTDGSVEIDGSGAAPLTVTLTKTGRIMAVAYGTNYYQSTAVNVFFTLIAPTPVITFSGSGASETATITNSNTSQNFFLYYTIDGSTATTSSTPYSVPFHVTSGTKISAVSIAAYFATSSPASAVAP